LTGALPPFVRVFVDSDHLSTPRGLPLLLEDRAELELSERGDATGLAAGPCDALDARERRLQKPAPPRDMRSQKPAREKRSETPLLRRIAHGVRSRRELASASGSPHDESRGGSHVDSTDGAAGFGLAPVLDGFRRPPLLPSRRLLTDERRRCMLFRPPLSSCRVEEKADLLRVGARPPLRSDSSDSISLGSRPSVLSAAEKK
jgi:hypothetical protein